MLGLFDHFEQQPTPISLSLSRLFFLPDTSLQIPFPDLINYNKLIIPVVFVVKYSYGDFSRILFWDEKTIEYHTSTLPHIPRVLLAYYN